VEDVESFYFQYRHHFRVCYDRNSCGEDYHCLFCSKPGSRPWIWWKFEAGYDEVPKDQLRDLSRLRALVPGEKQAALRRNS